MPPPSLVTSFAPILLSVPPYLSVLRVTSDLRPWTRPGTPFGNSRLRGYQTRRPADKEVYHAAGMEERRIGACSDGSAGQQRVCAAGRLWRSGRRSEHAPDAGSA